LCVFTEGEKSEPWPIPGGSSSDHVGLCLPKETLRGVDSGASRHSLHADIRVCRLLRKKDKGSLEQGKFDDLAVLSQDISKVPAEDLPKTESVLTLVDGKVIYDAKVVAMH